MPDNWGFVVAAYGLTAAVLGMYWRSLATKEREIQLTAQRRHARPTADRTERLTVERSHEPSGTGHPRPDPASRPPLQ